MEPRDRRSIIGWAGDQLIVNWWRESRIEVKSEVVCDGASGRRGQKLKFHELSPAFGSDDFQAPEHHETKHPSVLPVLLLATIYKQP